MTTSLALDIIKSQNLLYYMMEEEGIRCAFSEIQGTHILKASVVVLAQAATHFLPQKKDQGENQKGKSKKTHRLR